MAKVSKQLETALDNAIKNCNDNLPNVKITATDVKGYLMEFVKSVNKLYKAKAGLGTVKLTINKDKILDPNIDKANAYAEKLIAGLRAKATKTTMEVIFANGIQMLPLFRKQVNIAAAELQCLQDNNKNFANIYDWFNKLIAGETPEAPNCPGIERLNSLELILSKDPAVWQVLTLRILENQQFSPALRAPFYKAAEWFSDSMLKLRVIFEKNRAYLLSNLANYRQYENENEWWETLRDVALGLWRLTNTAGFVDSYIAPLEKGLADSVNELQADYQELEQFEKEKKARDNNKVLVAAKAFKTKPSKKTCCALIDLAGKNTSILNKKRRDALKKLKTAVKNLSDGLLPKQ